MYKDKRAHTQPMGSKSTLRLMRTLGPSLASLAQSSQSLLSNTLGWQDCITILPFRGSNWVWKSEPLHLNNWAVNSGFALCNQFNQVYFMGLIKAHPFLLSIHYIYQWSQLVRFLVTSFCTKTDLETYGQDLGLNSFLSIVLHSFPSFHFCSSFFSHKFIHQCQNHKRL